MIIDMSLHWYPDFFYTDKEFFKECLRTVPRGYGEHLMLRMYLEAKSRLNFNVLRDTLILSFPLRPRTLRTVYGRWMNVRSIKG